MLGAAPERGAATELLIDACRKLEPIADVIAVLDDLALQICPDRPPRLAVKLERGSKPGWIPVRKIQTDEHLPAVVHRHSEVIEQPRLGIATRPVIGRQ